VDLWVRLFVFDLVHATKRVGVCRFNGSAGQAIVSKTTAYLVTDSRYWLQAQEQLDSNWRLVQGGHTDGPKDWIEWLVVS
jgi:Xaa-Pro aminopeptidase